MAWLLTAWRWISTSRAGQAVGVVLLAMAGAWALISKGRSLEKSDHEREDLQNEVEAHDRINRAPDGADLDDDERIKRLSRIGRGDWDGD